ncbi:hypothetical protein [Pseudoalteromonas sp. Ps84H-4]|uniref:hypothetical protein n=1 Tax=Pseudoalteromonas sp. Ps84H-4 TaxID=2954502 RepID=UPI002096CBBB|nr:hypothetical protein [Pseudoalteromonas sp. Ps84H-4]MCO7251663.1 hypothetical protein [Pseudoalteromonas sp. Ps84H-4]
MQTFEITSTTRNTHSLKDGTLICSEIIKHHDSLKDILRELGVDVGGKERGKYLKALSLLNGGMALNKVIAEIAGGNE